jgi:F-type H+-transporting ATPase subunit a
MRETLDHNATLLGNTMVGKIPANWSSFEPIVTALLVGLLILLIAVRVRSRLDRVDEALVPEERLTLRTFMETFLWYVYDLAKGVMGPDRAKKYFPLIGTSAIFVFFANLMAVIPGMPIATSSLGITFGSAMVVFVLFNAYGFFAQGWAYLKHLAGPVWWLSPLIFILELLSVCIRPATLAVRLMANMAADHLLLGLFLGICAILVPIPVMVLGCLVVVVQTLVFTLLTCVYIGLATEPLEEGHH